MRILGLDTATRATAVALCDVGAGAAGIADVCLDDPAAAFERRDDPPPGVRPRHTSRLLPLTFALLADTATAWPDVDRIAVGLGPGTFTGLRIGIATARGLAEARGLPLIGVSTLQSLALGAVPQARTAGAELIAAVIDARRGELFAAAWAPGPAGVPGSAPAVAERAYRPEELASALGAAGARVMVAGDGAVPFRELLERHGALVPPDDSGMHRVSAVGHCRLGAAIDSDHARPAGDVSPRYLRLPDAELSRRAAQR